MAKQNLFTTLLTEAITAGSTSIKVDTGRVQLVDSTLIGEILTIMPLAEIASFTNSEMVKVTGVSGNTLSVTRAQNGTLAKDFAKDSVVVLASTVEDYLIKKNKSILLSCDTAANDSPKVCASSTGSYTPAYGDELIVDFINGCDKDAFTLAVDGAGELLVKIGTENATTQHLRSSSRIKVPMWFDGSFYQLYGSQRNDATVNSFGYGVTASATSSVLSIGAGRAVINGKSVSVTAKTLASSTTTVPASGTGYIGIKDNNQLSVSTTGFLPGVLPVCVVVKDSSNKWLPNSIINFNQVKSSNIDFTTYYRTSGTLQSQTLTQTLVENTTITIPPGVKAGTLVELSVAIEYNNGGGGLKDMQCRVSKNGTSLGDRYVGAIGGLYYMTGNYLAQFAVSAGDSIVISFAKSNSESGGAVSSRSQYSLKQG